MASIDVHHPRASLANYRDNWLMHVVHIARVIIGVIMGLTISAVVLCMVNNLFGKISRLKMTEEAVISEGVYCRAFH